MKRMSAFKLKLDRFTKQRRGEEFDRHKQEWFNNYKFIRKQEYS